MSVSPTLPALGYLGVSRKQEQAQPVIMATQASASGWIDMGVSSSSLSQGGWAGRALTLQRLELGSRRDEGYPVLSLPSQLVG